MLIKIFNKKITLDCFTIFPKVFYQHQIKKSKEFIPEWTNKIKPIYKDYSGKEKESLITKNYFNDLYKNGFIVPMWTDVTIEVNEFGRMNVDFLQNDYFKFNFETFDFYYYQPEMFSNVIPIKFMSPWILKQNKNIKFNLNPILWNHIKIVDCFWFLNKMFSFEEPKYLNIDCLINVKKGRQGIVEGTPIVQLMPLTEEDIDIKCHLIEEKDLNNIINNENI